MVVGRARGSFELDDIREFVVNVAASPDNSPEVAELLDLRDCTVGDISPDEISRFTQIVDSLYGEPKRAPLALVADRELEYGMARIYGAYRESTREVRVFRRMTEARAWLGYKPAPREPERPRRHRPLDAPE